MARKSTTKVSFTTGELARIFNVTDETIRNWIKRGIIPVTKLPSGRNQIDRHTVLNLMRKYNIPDDRLKEAPRVKILLVDREENIRTLFAKNFEGKHQYDVRTSANPFAAGWATKEFRPDVLLLDVYVQGVKPREVCQAVKADADTRNTKVVAMSGHFSDEQRTQWAEDGFSGFLEKPFTFEELIDCIEAALEATPVESR